MKSKYYRQSERDNSNTHNLSSNRKRRKRVGRDSWYDEDREERHEDHAYDREDAFQPFEIYGPDDEDDHPIKFNSENISIEEILKKLNEI